MVTIDVATKYDLGEELIRWEIATAIAGAILGINPFDQPDVESSKVATRALTAEFEKTGRLPVETPFFDQGGVKLFADPVNSATLTDIAKRRAPDPTLLDYLRAHLDRLREGDYFAILAFIQMNQAHEARLGRLRRLVRDHRRVATCLGFGPRFLHSTGQVYKGGPPSGVFLQITADDSADLSIPGYAASFGVVKAAQARGDLQVLAERKRRLLRLHLGADLDAGLAHARRGVRRAVFRRGPVMAADEDVYPHATRKIAEMRERLAPAAAQAFHAFGKAVFAEGTLSTKTKQLIAVAVAHVTQCPYCIRGHTRARDEARRHTGGDHGSDLGRRRDARRRCLRARDRGTRCDDSRSGGKDEATMTVISGGRCRWLPEPWRWCPGRHAAPVSSSIRRFQ